MRTMKKIQMAVRCQSALSHVPVADVQEAFDLLTESFPQAEHTNEVVSYFEHTYVRGRRLRDRGDNYSPPIFTVESWN